MQQDPLFGASHRLVVSLLRLRAACPAIPWGMGDGKAGAKAFTVLFTLCHHPQGSLTMSRLAACLGLSPPQLSKIVAPLEERRLVRRCHDEMNRRLVTITVTDPGRQAMEAATCQAASALLPQLSTLTGEEQQALEQSLATVEALLMKSGCRTW